MNHQPSSSFCFLKRLGGIWGLCLYSLTKPFNPYSSGGASLPCISRQPVIHSCHAHLSQESRFFRPSKYIFRLPLRVRKTKHAELTRLSQAVSAGQKRFLSIHEYQSVNLLNSVCALRVFFSYPPICRSIYSVLFFFKYGVPTPKGIAAKSPKEAIDAFNKVSGPSALFRQYPLSVNAAKLMYRR